MNVFDIDKREILFVQQPDNLTCTVACVAMIAGVSFDDALFAHIDLGKPPYAENESMIALVRLGVFSRKQIDNQLIEGRLYMADVPSINVLGVMHAIVIDTRNKDSIKVYDPQQGKENIKHYTYEILQGFSNLIWCIKVK